MKRIAYPILFVFFLSGCSYIDVYEFRVDQEASLQRQGPFKVISVVDGDTIKVDVDGTKESIRMIGIDTPEIVDPRKPVQCYGPEASSYAHRKLENRTVYLVSDSTQGERDKYNRILVYVYIADEQTGLWSDCAGCSYSYDAVRSGYAKEYTYNSPYAYQLEFKQAQALAQSEGSGLWGKCI